MNNVPVVDRPVLGYWNIRGLGQQIRFMLIYLDVEFEDVAYTQGDGPEFSMKEWTDVKHELGLSFPNLPYYIDVMEDVRLTESNAIMKYIAVKYRPASMLGKTADEQGMCDMLAGVLNTLKNQVT